MSIFHSPVGGGHGWSALHDPKRPSLRRTDSAWAVRSLLRVTAPRLYAAPHASRPRGPPNWLQDRGREGGRWRGGGDRAATVTPPAAPVPAGAGRSRSDLGPDPSVRCREATTLRASAALEAALPRAPRATSGRPGTRRTSDTSKGRELSGSDRGNRSLSRKSGDFCPRHLWSPLLPNFGRSERSLWGPTRSPNLGVVRPTPIAASAWGPVARCPRSICPS